MHGSTCNPNPSRTEGRIEVEQDGAADEALADKETFIHSIPAKPLQVTPPSRSLIST